MKKRDIIILACIGVVVIIVAWFFLVISPKRDELSRTEQDLQQQQDKYQSDLAKVKRLSDERTAAQQTEGQLMTLNKLVPADEQIPSMIVELQQSANDAGIYFMKIEPGTPIAGSDGGTVIPLEVIFQGRLMEVQDFLYRVENYARLEGNDVNVTGRLINVMGIEMKEPSLETPDPSDGLPKKFPNVMTTLQINAYTTAPPPAPATGTSKAGASGGGGTEGGTGGTGGTGGAGGQ